MRIHHLHGDSFIIESLENFILVDPMFSKSDHRIPFLFHKQQNKQDVPLSKKSIEVLNSVNHCLLTHLSGFGCGSMSQHDHFGKPGQEFLLSNGIPVTCKSRNVICMEKKGFTVESSFDFWERTPFLNGFITAVPAQHGHGLLHKIMPKSAGLFLELPMEPSVYISGDTIYTDSVKDALLELQPDITIVSTGSTDVDFGGLVSMTMDEVIKFIEESPKKVIANHLDTLVNKVSRKALQYELEAKGLLEKVLMPEDGETVVIVA